MPKTQAQHPKPDAYDARAPAWRPGLVALRALALACLLAAPLRADCGRLSGLYTLNTADQRSAGSHQQKIGKDIAVEFAGRPAKDGTRLVRMAQAGKTILHFGFTGPVSIAFASDLETCVIDEWGPAGASVRVGKASQGAWAWYDLSQHFLTAEGLGAFKRRSFAACGPVQKDRVLIDAWAQAPLSGAGPASLTKVVELRFADLKEWGQPFNALEPAP